MLSAPAYLLARIAQVAANLREALTAGLSDGTPPRLTEEQFRQSDEEVRVTVDIDGTPTTITIPANNATNFNRMLAAAILKLPPAVALTYENGFTDYGSGFRGGHFWTDAQGLVHLDGEVNNATSAATPVVIATLPAGFRPDAKVQFSTWSGAAPGGGLVSIATNGAVTLEAAGGNDVSLNGIFFRPTLG